MLYKNKNKFIYICGIDGSGKTTLSKNISRELHEQSIFISISDNKKFITEIDNICHKYNTTRWNEFSSYFRGSIWGMELLYFSNFSLQPLLQKYKYVITDRYSICNEVYSNLEKDNFFVRTIHKNLIQPDIIFYLDIPPTIAYRRIISRGTLLTPKEDLKMLELARKKYIQHIKNNSNIIKLDATKTENELIYKCIEIIKNMDYSTHRE